MRRRSRRRLRRRGAHVFSARRRKLLMLRRRPSGTKHKTSIVRIKTKMESGGGGARTKFTLISLCSSDYIFENAWGVLLRTILDPQVTNMEEYDC